MCVRYMPVPAHWNMPYSAPANHPIGSISYLPQCNSGERKMSRASQTDFPEAQNSLPSVRLRLCSDTAHICSEDQKFSLENWMKLRKQRCHYLCNKTRSCSIESYIIIQVNNRLQSLIFLSLRHSVSDELSCVLPCDFQRKCFPFFFYIIKNCLSLKPWSTWTLEAQSFIPVHDSHVCMPPRCSPRAGAHFSLLKINISHAHPPSWFSRDTLPKSINKHERDGAHSLDRCRGLSLFSATIMTILHFRVFVLPPPLLFIPSPSGSIWIICVTEADLLANDFSSHTQVWVKCYFWALCLKHDLFVITIWKVPIPFRDRWCWSLMMMMMMWVTHHKCHGCTDCFNFGVLLSRKFTLCVWKEEWPEPFLVPNNVQSQYLLW